ncbi:PREDICTED: uncharacterized protein LOC108767760 [Trachymyrmex cornetzi]|uniref:uncharacterized protein LOC108767760 n=1 Tax=Trachymyrmex cornetzi TaxID=471704 RepID=UPI00084F5B7E|nr:PREDICTED: uncharacterized protein LOC108767760 [Trachymyrmex cornetzi]
MADEEEMSTKAKLSKLHCPFTWEILDSLVKHSLIHQKQDDENDDNEIDDERSYSLEQLLISLFKCYKALLSADNDEVTKRIEKAEEILKQIQQKIEFNQVIRTIEHVFYATKCFILYDADDIDGLEEILQNVIDPKDFNDIELGALYGCQSVVWSCLNDFGMHKAVDMAKKAVERDQNCALWHFILAKNLRRQRRTINVAFNVSDSEKTHFEIAFAISKNDRFGVYYLQMRIESFDKYNRDRVYMMRRNANEREVINIAKRILKTKPTNNKVLLRLALMFLRASSDERLFAKECLDAVYKITPNNSTCLHYTAILYEQSGDYKEALKYFKKAAECNNLVAELAYIQYGWEVGELEPLPHLLRMLKKYDQVVKERQIAILLAIAVTYYSLHNDILNAAEYFLKAFNVDSSSNKFKTFYRFLDFDTSSIVDFLNHYFCYILKRENSRSHKKMFEEIRKYLDVQEVMEELYASVDLKKKHSNLNTKN